jgi:hypothetical protein
VAVLATEQLSLRRGRVLAQRKACALVWKERQASTCDIRLASLVIRMAVDAGCSVFQPAVDAVLGSHLGTYGGMARETAGRFDTSPQAMAERARSLHFGVARVALQALCLGCSCCQWAGAKERGALQIDRDTHANDQD